MAVWARIKNMSPREIIGLVKVFIRQPRFIIPTIKATRKSLSICDELYEGEHHDNNRTNAFRHGLWNFLLCEEYFKVCGSVEKSVEWSKKITDLHEELAPNNRLEKTMDLHNNMVGRKLFKKFHSEENLNSIGLLKKEMLKAVKVSKFEEIKSHPEHMVYIEDRK